MNISDFLFALGKTIDKLNTDKIKAKECIEELKYNMTFREDVFNKCKIAENALDMLYLSLPKKDRQDYIQKTLDLFNYGFTIPNNTQSFNGYIELMGELYDKAKYTYETAKKEYKKKNYAECVSMYEEYLNDLKTTLTELGVID